jgi:hypothetical protein
MELKRSLIFLSAATLEGIAAILILVLKFAFKNSLTLSGWAASKEIWIGRAGLTLILLLIVFLSIITFKAFRDRSWLAAAYQRLADQLNQGHSLLVLAETLVFFILLGAGLLFLISSPAAFERNIYQTLFTEGRWITAYERLRDLLLEFRPVLLWVEVVLAQIVILLLTAFPQTTQRKGFLNGAVIWKTLLLLTLSLALLFHWVTLLFELRFFANIGGWYWVIQRQPIHVSWLIFPMLLALALALFYFVLKKSKIVWLSLLLLVTFGYVLQVGLGFINGQGYEYTRLKYAGTLHRSYAVTASTDNLDPIQNVRNYESLYQGRLFPGTKPPGVLTFYIFTEKLVNWIHPQPTPPDRFLALTTFEAYIFPLLSFLVLIALYAFTRSSLHSDSAFFPSILYLVIPNVLLFPLFLDQVLYPLLFTLGVWLVVVTVRKGSFWLAVLTGAYLYLVVFFSFSMLPLIPLALLLIILESWLNRKDQKLTGPIKILAGITLGLCILSGLFYVFLNYNFIDRYSHAMATVHYTDYYLRKGSLQKGTFDTRFFPSPAEITSAMVLNNLDFAAAVGFPLFILFLSRGLKTMAAFLRKRATRRDAILGAYFFTYLALNLYGQNRGESARLWLFWVPMVVIFASEEISAIFAKKERAVLYIAAVQLITVFLTFLFQDLRM